jgi:hypothetical protein
VLTWADIDVTEENRPIPLVKSVTFKLEAGDIATVEVETYDVENTGGYNIATNTTNIKEYCVDKILIEAKSSNEIRREQVEKKQEDEDFQMNNLREKRLAHISSISELEV